MSLLARGIILHGYCGGFFGDSYGPKRVEDWGVDWIVARDEDGDPLFCRFEPHWLQKRDELIMEWLQ